MKRKFVVFGSAALALAASAFTTAKDKLSDPSVIYFENNAGTCIQLATGFTSYFTLTSGSNQAAIRSISGASNVLWGESDCDDGATDLPVYFNDPF